MRAAGGYQDKKCRRKEARVVEDAALSPKWNVHLSILTGSSHDNKYIDQM